MARERSAADDRIRERLAGKRSVFLALFFAMIAFGVLIGFVFPPFAEVVLNTDAALTFHFFTMCILAGFIIGVVNFLLFRMVVSRAIDRVVAAMRRVLDTVLSSERMTGDSVPALEITSSDSIGRIESTFNDMTVAVSRRVNLEAATRSLLSALSESVELKEVAVTILQDLVDTCDARGGVLYTDTGEAFELVADIGIDRTDLVPERLSSRLGPVASALQSGEIKFLRPVEDGLEWIQQSTPLGGYRPKSVVVVPLTTKESTGGVAILARAESAMPPAERQTLETLRTQGTPYLQNAVLHGKITDLAAIDDLTRILNRRFGMRRLKEEFSRSVRSGVPVSVLMFDVDHFKNFNDAHGHDAGDAVLKRVASLAEEHVRTGDIVCRYGGEEFLVVEPGAGLDEAVAVAERIRAIIEEADLEWEGQHLRLTVSIGVATWPIVSASAPEEVITAADKALYHAKETGRNRVSAHRGDTIISAGDVVAG